MDNTVTTFYAKNPEEDYIHTYDQQHGGRLDAAIKRFGLDKLRNAKVIDIGGGLGFLGKRLDPSNDYLVIDGAEVDPKEYVCPNMYYYKTDLDCAPFGDNLLAGIDFVGGYYIHADVACFFETIEHLSNPYHALVELKKIVKTNGDIIISYPTETVWHNTVYPGLLWPRGNFEVFLHQMALPPTEFWFWDPPKGGGWPAYHYRCRNAPWVESRMIFPKHEAKFQGKTPLEYTNL